MIRSPRGASDIRVAAVSARTASHHSTDCIRDSSFPHHKLWTLNSVVIIEMRFRFRFYRNCAHLWSKITSTVLAGDKI